MKTLPALIITCFALTGCNLYRDYSRPDTLPTEDLYATDPMAAAADSLSPLGSLPWQQVFTDPDLQELINRALQSNTDLQVALLRIDQAEAGLKAAKLAFLPSVTLSPQASVSSIGGGKASTSYQIPVNISWEADIFGKLRNARKESQAVMLQQTAYASAVRSGLIASVANSYYTLLMLDSQIELSDKAIEVWREQLRTLRLQLRVGNVRDNAVNQAQANLDGLLATHNTLVRQQHDAITALCTLLGTTCSDIRRGTLDAQQLPDNLSTGLPLYLLSNRPDVVSAEMALAATCYATNRSRAAFYPSLTLGGTAGWTDSFGQAVTNPGGWLLSALASVTQPIFQRGQLKANLRIAEDEEQIALLNYRQTILNAGQEVNDASYAIASLATDIEHRSAQCEALQQTVRANEVLFRTANATYLELLTSRQDLLNANLGLVADRAARMQAVVTLYRALGGGS